MKKPAVPERRAVPPTWRSGIYEIFNIVNGKRYIGSAADFKRRWSKHKRSANGGYHDNSHLQRSWNKYGSHAFEFRRLLICHKDNLLFYEQKLLDAFKPEYNISPTAGSILGYRYSQEVRKKLSLAHLGRKHSEETKAKIGASHLGQKRSTQARLNMSAAQKRLGRKLSAEHREKLSIANSGKVVSEATREKLSAANIRRWAGR